MKRDWGEEERTEKPERREGRERRAGNRALNEEREEDQRARCLCSACLWDPFCEPRGTGEGSERE